MPSPKKSVAMPKWTKAPEALVKAFESALKLFPDTEARKMFGYPAAFINGQMFAGLFQDRMMMRLSISDREEFLKQKGSKLFEPMPGRPMKEYVEVPAALLRSVKQLNGWLGKSVVYTKSLPPKKKKSPAKKS